MKYARIVNNTAVDVRTESPEGCFTPDIVAEFVEVPDEVRDGWSNATGTWLAPAPAPQPTPAPTPLPTLTPMQFYLAFTPTERVAIKTSTDEMVKEFWATYQLAVQANASIDPNLRSVSESLNFLATPIANGGPGILAAGRPAQIRQGIPQ